MDSNKPAIYWNNFPSDDGERTRWYFLIVNRLDRLSEEEIRVYRALENVEIDIANEGNVKGRDDLKYKLIVLDSRIGRLDWNKVTNNLRKVHRDPELRPRTRARNGLENYVSRMLG